MDEPLVLRSLFPWILAVLSFVLVLVALWTFRIPGKILDRLTRKKGTPNLDPIGNMGQVNYAIASRCAGKIDDQTWEKIVPLIEIYLKENYFPRVGIHVETMETFGKGIKEGR